MQDRSFSTSFTVAQSPDEVFAAITNPRGWWSEGIEGRTEKLDDEFTHRHKDMHRCTMRLTEVVPGKRLVWLCLDNYFSFTKDETEWTGTQVIFDIAREGGKTTLRFTHQGLVPDYECYDSCSDAWSSIIKGDLRELITSAKGQPGPKE